MRLIADTTVLVDMWRLRRAPHRLAELRGHMGEPVLAWQALFEFLRGAFARGMSDAALRRFLSFYTVLAATESQVWSAARIDADLTRTGLSIGPGDPWIAAAALETGLPILTRNGRHFSRVPGVEVIEYSILP